MFPFPSPLRFLCLYITARYFFFIVMTYPSMTCVLLSLLLYLKSYIFYFVFLVTYLERYLLFLGAHVSLKQKTLYKEHLRLPHSPGLKLKLGSSVRLALTTWSVKVFRTFTF